MKNPDRHKIDEYLLSLMGLTEHKKFEEQMAHDADLQTAVEERRELIGYVDALGDIQMKERVRRIHEKELGRSAKIRRMGGRRYAVAAAIALMVGLALWVFLRPPSNASLYADYYEPYAMNFGARGGNADQQLAEAGSLYKNGNYEKAIPVFNSLLNEDIDNEDGVKLALGISYMEMGDNEKAIVYFENLINKKDAPYYEQGLWYAALAETKQGENESAINHLRALSEVDGSYYFEKSAALLEELKKGF